MFQLKIRGVVKSAETCIELRDTVQEAIERCAYLKRNCGSQFLLDVLLLPITVITAYHCYYSVLNPIAPVCDGPLTPINGCYIITMPPCDDLFRNVESIILNFMIEIRWLQRFDNQIQLADCRSSNAHLDNEVFNVILLALDDNQSSSLLTSPTEYTCTTDYPIQAKEDNQKFCCECFILSPNMKKVWD